MFRKYIFALLLSLLFSFPVMAEKMNDDNIRKIKKISDALNLARIEYAESVADGKIISQDEYDETNLFLNQALSKLSEVENSLKNENMDNVNQIRAEINSILVKVEQKASPEIMNKEVSATDKNLSSLAGVSLLELPLSAPSAEKGRTVYEKNCALCHGIKAFGDGPSASTMNPPPANFHSEKIIRETSPYTLYRAIKNGNPGAGMPSWEYQLSQEEKWDVINYIRSITHQSDSKSADIFNQYVKNKPVYKKINDITFTADLSDFDLISILKEEKSLSEFSDNDLYNLVSYIRTNQTNYNNVAGTKESSMSKKEYLESRISEIKALLLNSQKAYQQGNYTEAKNKVTEAYMSFEPVERELAAKDKDMARKLELDFNNLKGISSVAGNSEKSNTLIIGISEELDNSVITLTEEKSNMAIMLQSMFLILREGFEAILIITALIAFVRKSQAGQKLVKNIYIGVGLGIIASFITAVIIEIVLKNTSFSKEVLEGSTVLLAAAVLFYVSHWLISNTQAQKWQKFISSQLKSAMSNSNQMAIVSVGFLSVYREGFETMLFYKALYTSLPNSGNMLGIGFVAGCAALAVMTILFYKFSVKIPIREFFIVTSIFLYYMVISFVGKGLHEFQEANIISTTSINIPTIDLIGLYPTLETTLAQLFILAAWIGAVLYSFSVKPKSDKIARNAG